MILLQSNDSLAETSDLVLAVVVVGLERLLVDDTRLLLEFLVFLLQHLPVLLHVAERLLLVVELVVEHLQLVIVRRVLLLHVLQLLTRVRQYHHRVRYLLTQLVQLFVSLFNLLVEGLVLDLELLEVDEVEAVSELLLLLEHLLLVREAVSQRDVLQPKLIHLLVLLKLTLLLHSDVVRGDLLASATVDSVLCDTALEVLELSLDFFALSLFLVQLGLQLSRHLIVAILCLLQVETHLMHICQGIEILMFIHLLSISLRVSITADRVRLLLIHCGVHEHDLSLELLVVSLECVLLAQCLFDCDDQLPPQLVLLVQVRDLIDTIVVVSLVHVVVIIRRAVMPTALLAYGMHL